MAEERWVDIEDPREQFEAAFGITLHEWQWDYIEHLRRGERLVPKGRNGSQWIPDERLPTPKQYKPTIVTGRVNGED